MSTSLRPSAGADRRYLAVPMAALLSLAAPALAHAPDPASSPELLAEARAARDAKDFDRAEHLARQGMARSGEAVWPLTLALVLADKGRTTDALAVLSAPWPIGLPVAERLMAEAYAYSRGGDRWAALTAYSEVLLRQPGNLEARDAAARILDSLRAPYGAAALAGSDPPREANQAAALVRWGGTLEAPDSALRFAETDRALARLDALIAGARSTQPLDPGLVRRLRLDRLVALRDRHRTPEVIAEAAALAAEAPLPSYATHALADALLYARRPQEARGAYEAVLAAEPSNMGARYGRVFALLESERLAEAVAAADAITEGQAPFRAYADGPAIHPNPEYAYSTRLAGEVRLWSGDVAVGYRRLKALAEAAPADPQMQRAYVSALRARGWTKAARQQAAIAASLEPASPATQLMLGEAALARGDLHEADAVGERLTARDPTDPQVRRFAREVAAASGWLLETEIGPKWNKGGGANAAGREWTSSVRLETPWVTDGVGLFVFNQVDIAHPKEGRASRTRTGGGVAFRRGGVTSTVYAVAQSGSASQGSAGFTFDWQATDHLALGLAGETASRMTPVRAVLNGVEADSISARVAWRQDEATRVWAAGDLLSYSDGNDQTSVSAGAERSVWVRPHYDVTLRAGLWYTHNIQPGGPYFAPESGLSGSVGLTLQHRAWRRYERMFSHALVAELGFHDQEGFAASWTGSLRYEHRWRYDPWREVYYAALIDRRVYDGDPERGLGAVLGFRRRF